MNKNAIQKYAVWARNELIEQIKQRAYQYEISEKGYGNAYTAVVAGRVLSDEEKRQRSEFIGLIKRIGYQQAIEEVAYTWFNRFVAIRFMEVNDYLPTHIRVFSDSNGAFNPEILQNVLHLELPGLNKAKVSELINANATDDLYRYLLLTQCNALNEALPEMFEQMGGYTEMLLPNNILRQDSVLDRLVTDISEEDWHDAVQIIGWMYQYYNTEPKQAVFDGLKKNIKITKEKIPAATQLFTPDWIVRYMVENSLGRIFVNSQLSVLSFHNEVERIAKEREIADGMGWRYYLPEAEQTPEVRAQLTTENLKLKTLNVEDIKLIDPCMGSGHILVYAFDVLIQIYRTAGYADRDATKLIMEKNLYGLDIDRRAYQFVYFSLMMKARQYNRRILNDGVKPQVYHPAGFPDGEEYGSLAKIDALPPKPEESKEITLFTEKYETALNAWNFKRLLTQKYDVVVTNPPYMGSSGMNGRLAQFIKDYYPDSKSDSFSAFIERGLSMIKPSGYSCMVTMQSWMFLASFETMRQKILSTTTIVNLMHMENMVMGIAFGTAVSNLRGRHITGYKGQYNHIEISMIENDKPKLFPPVGKRNIAASANNFVKIPGSPVAYWVRESTLSCFENTKIESMVNCRSGIMTGDDSYIKTWSEINLNNIKFDCLSFDDMGDYKWFPLNSGGDFRKWYGNNTWVVNLWCDGFDIRSNVKNYRLRDKSYYFKRGITWGRITSAQIAFRDVSVGSLFGDAGPIGFVENNRHYILGFLCSKIALYFIQLLNPTLNCQVRDIQNLPIKISSINIARISSLVENNIKTSQDDWDAFEASWDFQRHPLSIGKRAVKSAFVAWGRECDERFNALKANEEELNRIFIDIYGLQDELAPEVEDKDVTVRRADLGREIRSLISYAVGCMFGRYSIYMDGLMFAGEPYSLQAFVAKLNERPGTISKAELERAYRNEGVIINEMFYPDEDNIIPICDDEYFEDDIVARFVEFVCIVYGAETLEENLKFIADALGGRGTSREVIRNYFLNDFHKDHCKIYQKRPIYWLFDSGKKNGFKALMYLHRYSRDLLAKLRTDYVHEQQERYRTQLMHIAEALQTAKGANHVKLNKQQNKVTEQLREIGVFEEKVHHLADRRIEIDLDNGVKRNYEIFADVLAKI